jgi:hypothetical protein
VANAHQVQQRFGLTISHVGVQAVLRREQPKLTKGAKAATD